MRKSRLTNTLLAVAVGVIGLGVTASNAFAQVEGPSRISIQGTGLFTRSFKSETPSHEASKSGGFLVGYSYQFNSWFEAQGNYGYSRNTQNYNAGAPTAFQADFHEMTGTLVAHLPFALHWFFCDYAKHSESKAPTENLRPGNIRTPRPLKFSTVSDSHSGNRRNPSFVLGCHEPAFPFEYPITC